MTVLDTYFELSDRAIQDESALQELVDLFADDAEILPSGADKVKGKANIEQLYRRFFNTYEGVQRVWQTRRTEQGIEATWAIAGKKNSGEIFSIRGTHIAEINEHGKIESLEVQVAP
ncbi:MAG: nuclear transport factor 2 family protein [Pseudanabaenaceae cyanobacterium]|jgi:hypothetical protein